MQSLNYRYFPISILVTKSLIKFSTGTTVFCKFTGVFAIQLREPINLLTPHLINQFLKEGFFLNL